MVNAMCPGALLRPGVTQYETARQTVVLITAPVP